VELIDASRPPSAATVVPAAPGLFARDRCAIDLVEPGLDAVWPASRAARFALGDRDDSL